MPKKGSGKGWFRDENGDICYYNDIWVFTWEFNGSKHKFLMTVKEYHLLYKMIRWCIKYNKTSDYELYIEKNDIKSFMKIASRQTLTQQKKFENLVSEEWMTKFINRKQAEYKKEKHNKIASELELSKWNPRSVLGKLEFDRRAEEDGIKYFD